MLFRINSSYINISSCFVLDMVPSSKQFYYLWMKHSLRQNIGEVINWYHRNTINFKFCFFVTYSRYEILKSEFFSITHGINNFKAK